jgi:hypothetical protein
VVQKVQDVSPRWQPLNWTGRSKSLLALDLIDGERSTPVDLSIPDNRFAEPLFARYRNFGHA